MSRGKHIKKNDPVEIWPKALKAGCNPKKVVSGCVLLEGDHTAPAGTFAMWAEGPAPPLLIAFWKLWFPILTQTSAKAYREVRGKKEKKFISSRCADIFHLCYSNFSHP